MRKRQPLYRQSRFRFGLGTLLLLCGIVGSAIGLYVRWNPPKEPQNWTESWSLEGFRINIKWIGSSKTPSKSEFAYLLAYPDFVASPGDSNFGWVATKHDGIYIKTNTAVRGTIRTAKRPDCKFWVYVSIPKPDVLPVEGDFQRITPTDYAEFKNSILWNQHLRPMLIAESQRFDRWWFEQHGTRNPQSRFTTDETWDKWFSEKRLLAPAVTPAPSRDSSESKGAALSESVDSASLRAAAAMGEFRKIGWAISPPDPTE